MTEEDPFVGGEGEEDEGLIMAPLLVDKLQVSLFFILGYLGVCVVGRSKRRRLDTGEKQETLGVSLPPSPMTFLAFIHFSLVFAVLGMVILESGRVQLHLHTLRGGGDATLTYTPVDPKPLPPKPLIFVNPNSIIA